MQYIDIRDPITVIKNNNSHHKYCGTNARFRLPKKKLIEFNEDLIDQIDCFFELQAEHIKIITNLKITMIHYAAVTHIQSWWRHCKNLKK